MTPKERGTIKRFDLLGVDVGLVEEQYHHGVRLWGFISEQLRPSETIHFLLHFMVPASQAPCLPVHYHVPP